MNEIERMLKLPIRLNYPLPGLLKEVLYGTLNRARIQTDVDGMVKAVAWGFKSWEDQTWGIGMSRDQVQPAFVRMLAIAVPDLFVVAHDKEAFKGYKLDEDEQEVLADARETFQAKVAIAQVLHQHGKAFNFADFIRESPEFKRAVEQRDAASPRRLVRH
ncbi:hypothetical protein D3C71_24230 [compost metagenome]